MKEHSHDNGRQDHMVKLSVHKDIIVCSVSPMIIWSLGYAKPDYAKPVFGFELSNPFFEIGF